MKYKRKNNLKIDFKAEKYEKNINCPWLMRKISPIYTSGGMIEQKEKLDIELIRKKSIDFVN